MPSGEWRGIKKESFAKPTMIMRSPSHGLSRPWWDRLEKYRSPILFTLVAYGILVIGVTAHYGALNPDSFWHLRTGLDWLQAGQSPWKDQYSFTYFGERVSYPAYLFDAWYATLVMMFGEPKGAFLLKFLASALTFSAMLLWMKKAGATTLVYLLVLPLFTVVLQLRMLVRPEILSFALIPLALLLYRNCGQRLAARSMLPILLLMVFWSNYHSSALFGYVIFLGLFIDCGIKLLKDRAGTNQWISLLTWGLAILFSGFLNPDLSHPLISTLMVSASDWHSFIVEYYPPVRFFRSLLHYVLVAIAVTTLLLAVNQRRFGYVVALFVFLYAAITVERMIAPAAILCLAVFTELAVAGKFALAGRQEAPKLFKRIALFVAAALVFGPAMAFGPRHAWQLYSIAEGENSFQYPEHLAQHLQNDLQGGRVFNSYGVGGFLLHRLSPKFRVYIDGRTAILYPLSHLQRYLEALESSAVLIEEVDKWNVDHAALPADSGLARNAHFAGLELEFSDRRYALFRRDNGRLAAQGFVWAFPACMKSVPESKLKVESLEISLFEREETDFGQMVTAVDDYLSAADRRQHIQDSAVELPKSEAAKRFVFYRALDHNLPDEAAKVFGSLSMLRFKDVLAMTIAHLEAGNHESAEALLLRYLSWPTGVVELEDLKLQHSLLLDLEGKTKLDDPIREYLDGLSEALDQTHAEAMKYRPSLKLLCRTKFEN